MGMGCHHENPELCRLLGRHITGHLWAIWTGTSGLSAEKEGAYRANWIDRSGRPASEFEGMGSPKTKQTRGPGAHLRAMIRSLGFRPARGCKCRERARLMDRKGSAWCRRNLGTIIGWLKEEHGRAKAAKLTRAPWNHLAARTVVSLAIRRAERELK